jgi:hypothetical protein
MFLPFGWQQIASTEAPRSLKSPAARPEAEPFPQSTTMRIPLRLA